MRPWLAIPIVAVVAAAIAAVLGARGIEIGSAAAAAAAIVHALRAFAGDAPAALAGAAAGALLAIVMIAEQSVATAEPMLLPCIALAAASWTFAELARPTATPYVALAPAIAAAIIEPACVALVAIAGARLVTARTSRPVIEAALRAQLESDGAVQLSLPRINRDASRSGRVAVEAESASSGRASSGRVTTEVTSRQSKRVARAMKARAMASLSVRWVIAAPIAGAILILVAIVAGTADAGPLADAWYGPRTHDVTVASSVTQLGGALGPLAAVAALAGIAVLVRVHLASLAIVACAIGALLVDLRAGAPSAVTLGLASLCAGAGIARLAGMIRLRSGQAITGATCGVMLLVPPVWTVLG